MNKLYSMLVSTAVFAVSVSVAPKVSAAPLPEKFNGNYKFSSTLTVENKSYANQLKEEFVFEIAPSYDNSVLNDFISNAFIAADYDEATGDITLTTNTVRFGELPRYQYLGMADADATWTGMGAVSTSLVKWHVDADGKISVPDFTLVDYSKYSSTGKVTVVARFNDCKIQSLNDDEEEVTPETFDGNYSFTGRITDYIYETSVDEKGSDVTVLVDTKITEDAPIKFTINEYNQIIRFNDDYEMEANQVNTLRNRGYVKGMNYIMDVDTYNGIGWIYDTSDEDAAKTEAYLFNNNRDNDWHQGSVAFTMTKNDNDTYSLTPFTVWFRTMENQMGYGDVVNRVRVFRVVKKFENIKFVGFNETSSVENMETMQPDVVKYYNLQGVEVSNPSGGIFIRMQGNKASKVIMP